MYLSSNQKVFRLRALCYLPGARDACLLDTLDILNYKFHRIDRRFTGNEDDYDSVSSVTTEEQKIYYPPHGVFVWQFAER